MLRPLKNPPSLSLWAVALLVAVLLTSAVADDAAKTQGRLDNSSLPLVELTLGDSVVAFAKTLLGTPYHPGGCRLDAPGFDCSGLVQYSYAQFGIRLGRSSRDQALDGYAVTMQEVMPGDLLLFARSTDGRIFHAGLAMSSGTDSLWMIHSTQRLGVHETNITGMAYWRDKLVGVRRISR